MLVFAAVAHEYAHAVVALRQGDDTAYMLGRVTLNPVRHLDPFLSFLLPLVLLIGSHGQFAFGGAKPVPVNGRKFRNYRRGDILVSLAGVTANFVLAFAFAGLFVGLGLLARAAPGAAEPLADAQAMTLFGVRFNVLFCCFNLLPIPPLDGSHLLYHALPARLGAWYRRSYGLGFLPVLAILFFFPEARDVVLYPVEKMTALLTAWVRPFSVALG
jgi:Zn-dependent protease